MPRYDVFNDPDGDGYLLDVQTDFLDALNTRVVVPLRTRQRAPMPAGRLNPILLLGQDEYELVTQFMGAVPRSVLKQPVTNLRSDAVAITLALDLLLQGF